eukprot:TRINITY_DN1101_c0_g1_i1.p2 TRINITY_DN1101_c0_g1~~TRINITY_DN1101_c0_g1_i1.p2  ORF type:complete len:289 (+),score=70.17 TRINITY_DN1101_c0_g1_i1:2638-3504(+)
MESIGEFDGEKFVSNITRIEILAEQLLNYSVRSPETHRIFLEAVCVVELVKASVRLVNFLRSQRRMAVSEVVHNSLQPLKQVVARKSTQIEEIFTVEERTGPSTTRRDVMQKEMSSIIDSMKKKSNLCLKINADVEQRMGRSGKWVGLLSSLPIPSDFYRAYRFKDSVEVPFKIGEIIHILRPAIYCFALSMYGTQSFKPFAISLVLDLLRLLLQRKSKFFDVEEKEEMRHRIVELITNYFLRDPLYTYHIKAKLLEPVLNRVFAKAPIIRNIIFYIIEVRRSVCLLL